MEKCNCLPTIRVVYGQGSSSPLSRCQAEEILELLRQTHVQRAHLHKNCHRSIDCSSKCTFFASCLANLIDLFNRFWVCHKLCCFCLRHTLVDLMFVPLDWPNNDHWQLCSYDCVCQHAAARYEKQSPLLGNTNGSLFALCCVITNWPPQVLVDELFGLGSYLQKYVCCNLQKAHKVTNQPTN